MITSIYPDTIATLVIHIKTIKMLVSACFIYTEGYGDNHSKD